MILRSFGRQAFGADPHGYHTGRPAYPEWVWEVLRDRCGLQHGVAVFEIGAGTGMATRPLLDHGANPLIAVEPDARLAAYLRQTNSDPALTVVIQPFEEAVLPAGQFDLGISATAFHWLEENPALTKAGSLLRPGGWWVMVWNEFGDSDRPDPFHEATRTLLEGPPSPSTGNGHLSFSLDVKARRSALEQTQLFDVVEHQAQPWSLNLDPDQTVALYATFSNINIRPDREEVLRELGNIARTQFSSGVTRNMVTSLYIARRSSLTK